MTEQMTWSARKKIATVFLKKLSNDLPDVLNPESPLPLAVGIKEQIASRYPSVPPIILDRAITYWVHRPAYLRSVRDGDHRYNLDGEIQGDISDDQKEHSREKLKVFYKKMEKERAKMKAMKKAA